MVLPLLVAAGISALNPLFRRRRRALDAIAIGTSGAVAVVLGVLMVGTAHGDAVYWFAGFRPRHGVVIGIDFTASSLGAGLACLAAVLVTAAMLFSWQYFERVSTYYHALMLAFLAGMAGFCLTGDLFDLFVWFELMGVAAYALTAYRPEERGSLQGALTFAITNSVGSYLALSGIAVLYGRTGALNMAQIGRSLAHHAAAHHGAAHHGPDGLVIVTFVLIAAGLLVKAAIVPFQFWLADAIAVAPTPVNVLFSGVMVELGSYGVARVYWSMFGQALGHREVITRTLLTLGLLTAVTGAAFCVRERHLKRLLAFATISESGVVRAGVALATPLGLAGAAVYVLGHALAMAAAFLCAGIVLHRLGSVNEPALHGRGRALRATRVVFTLAAFGLAGLPPFATFLGVAWIDRAARVTAAWPLVVAVLVACATVVAGVLLRVAGGVFFGLGDPPAEDAQMARQSSEETGETDQARRRTPLTMIGPAAVLVVAALALTAVPRLGPVVQAAAVRLQDQAGYASTVLAGAHVAHPVAPALSASTGIGTAAVITGAVSTLGGLALAWLSLYRRRLPAVLTMRAEARWPGGARIPAALRALAGLQSGVTNDYVTWLVVGVACIGGVLAAAIR